LSLSARMGSAVARQRVRGRANHGDGGVGLRYDLREGRAAEQGHGGAEARGDCGGRTRSAVELAARGRESSVGGGGAAPAGGRRARGLVDLGRWRRGMGGKRTVEDCRALPLHSSTNEANRTVRLRSRGNASDLVVGRSRSTAG
jgi:hypothetical protein